MNRKIPYDQGLLAIVLALLGFGLIMVFSASTFVSGEIYGSQTRIFTRQLLAVLAGLIVLMMAMKIDYHFYQRPAVVYSLLALTTSLLIFLLLTPGEGGVRRWVSLGPVNFQPSELARLAVILFTSYYLVTRKEEFHSLHGGLLPYLIVLGAIVILILEQPDMGTASSVALVALVLLFLGGLRFRYLLGMGLLAAPAVYLLIVNVPYRFNRILTFLNPERDPYGTGYQIRQSLIALGSGGWGGLGYAQGKQKLFFLPEPHTDFIYAVIGEELGFLGCFALLALFALFFWKGVRVALRADTPFGTHLGLGIVCMIVLQAFVNMSVAASLMPTKGLPLPLVSVGGSSVVMTLAAVGVLLNISRHNECRSRSASGPRNRTTGASRPLPERPLHPGRP